MTLIITSLSKYGIVHASDSNLTDGNEENAGEGQKTFAIDYLNAGLTLAGAYSVNGVFMSIWMNNFIAEQQVVPNITLQLFAENLRTSLENEMLPEEKEGGSIIHIMGYVEENGRTHPEFWFVRNIHHLNPATGAYENVDENFELTEDFWGRDDVGVNHLCQFRQPGIYGGQLYINGFSPGRIAYNIAKTQLDNFFIDFWRENHALGFRPPQTLAETEVLVKLYMQVINALFLLRYAPGQIIGGNTQTHLIPQPANILHTR